MMTNFKRTFGVLLVVCAASMFTSCEVDEYYSDKKTSEPESKEVFDFSTTQEVDLIVDYSDYEIYGPVRFGIYTQNPIVNENDAHEYLDDDIKPVFEAYTDANGLFDQTVTLPAYAKVLHVVTGNFMVGLTRRLVEVRDGVARMKLDLATPAAAPKSHFAPRIQGEGELTDDISKMPWLSFLFASDSKLGDTKMSDTRIYKDWQTPLGKWNSATGRPNYLMDSSAPSELQFPESEVANLYDAACQALYSGQTLKQDYCSCPDFTLIKDSKLSIAALGAMTCWNSSLGYYYYTGENPPQSTMDLNIIMIYPNTQDGRRYTPWYGSQYNNNIGMVRGEAIQLYYYPNIADGDLSIVSDTFPKGTKIGFILKVNGWSNMGKEYSTSTGSKLMQEQMNIWSASTDGMAYDDGTHRYQNPDGLSKTAKFAYKSPAGFDYAIFSVEDALDDVDFDDMFFALNPANVFAELPTITRDGSHGVTTTRGVYAFEDRWPYTSDYDMNDVMVDCSLQQTFSGGNVIKQVFKLKTYQNIVALKSGLAAYFTSNVKPTSIVMKKLAPGATDPVTCSYEFDGQSYILTDDVKATIGTTYIFELNYSKAQKLSDVAKVHPFIWRDSEDGLRWEVHIPNEAPTSKMDMSFFRKGDDISDPDDGIYYMRKGHYPFSFYLDNARIDYFLETILVGDNESRPIDVFFPEFSEWSTSNGKRNADWYLHPAI